MAKLPAFQDDAEYAITLASPAEYNGQVLRPRKGAALTVKGKVAKAIKESIASAEKV